MIEHVTLSVVRVPMSKPFGHAQATRTVAENVLVTVKVDGITGIGECVPRLYVTGETVDSVCSAFLRMDFSDLGLPKRFGNLEQACRTVEALDLRNRIYAGRTMPAAACAL